ISGIPGPTDGSMTGKTVIVTGGNSGIGKATAVALARVGAQTVITARDVSRGNQAVAEIRQSSGSDLVELVVFDLADLASVRVGAAELLRRCDRIDVLINNAGLVLTDRSETVDGYESTFAVNHLGPFLLTTLLTDRLVAYAPSRVWKWPSPPTGPRAPGLTSTICSRARTTGACRYTPVRSWPISSSPPSWPVTWPGPG